ncbi:hypothetical protein MFFDBJGM_03493 [Pectobacterium versatile]|nr:hypothetical protein MFFDBJGM_03493 [Pectobacterium versatile]
MGETLKHGFVVGGLPDVGQHKRQAGLDMVG